MAETSWRLILGVIRGVFLVPFVEENYQLLVVLAEDGGVGVEARDEGVFALVREENVQLLVATFDLASAFLGAACFGWRHFLVHVAVVVKCWVIGIMGYNGV